MHEALRSFEVDAELAALPSALRNPIVVLDEENRPQPRRDVDTGNGMAAVVGRIRECPLLDVKLTLLSHNLVRGAAGCGAAQRRTTCVSRFFQIARRRKSTRGGNRSAINRASSQIKLVDRVFKSAFE